MPLPTMPPLLSTMPLPTTPMNSPSTIAALRMLLSLLRSAPLPSRPHVPQLSSPASMSSTESIQEIDNEVCTYSYQPKTEATTAKTVEVSFKKECDTQMVTVCQPTPGYGYHSYGHNYCKEVAQETCYNVPVLTVVEPAVNVVYPEPIKTCV